MRVKTKEEYVQELVGDLGWSFVEKYISRHNNRDVVSFNAGKTRNGFCVMGIYSGEGKNFYSQINLAEDGFLQGRRVLVVPSWHGGFFSDKKTRRLKNEMDELNGSLESAFQNWLGKKVPTFDMGLKDYKLLSGMQECSFELLDEVFSSGFWGMDKIDLLCSAKALDANLVLNYHESRSQFFGSSYVDHKGMAFRVS